MIDSFTTEEMIGYDIIQEETIVSDVIQEKMMKYDNI